MKCKWLNTKEEMNEFFGDHYSDNQEAMLVDTESGEIIMDFGNSEPYDSVCGTEPDDKYKQVIVDAINGMERIMDNEKFYFVVYINRGEDITVVDLGRNVDYQREDWHTISKVDFTSPDKAIAYARAVSKEHNLGYELFESRYHESLNECLELKGSGK